MANPLKKLFSPKEMVAPSLIRGELPSAKQAYGRCLSIAWPSAVESVLVALVSSVDTMMVSSLGPRAISAVGVTGQPRMLMMACILSLNMGVTAVVARRRGEGDMIGASRTLKQSLIISVLLGLIMVAISCFLTEPIMRLAGAQDEYIADSTTYFRIIMSGQFFACIGMTINAAQRGCGNTKVSMRSNVTANIVNIIFNYFLINGRWIFPRLEVVGAAIATAIGSFVAFLMALYSVLHPHKGDINLVDGGKWSFDKKTLSSVCRVAGGAFTEQISLRAGLFAFSSIIARLGTIQFATHQISMSLSQLIFSFADGLGVASSSLVGQSLGMKRPDLSTIYGKIGQRCSMLIGISLAALLIVFRRQLYGLFSNDPHVIALGMKLCYFVAVVCMIQTSQVVISGCLRGAGDSRYVALTSLLSIGTFRVGLSYLLCYPIGLGVYGAWIGFIVDQCTRLVLNYARFHKGKWSKIDL